MNNIKKCVLGILCVFLLTFYSGASNHKAVGSQGSPGDIDVTILYDNYVFTEGTKADWGFACLIEGTEKTILFDTGTRPDILWHNIKKLDVDIGKVEQIVISHNHGDHTGGLASVLEKNKNVSVYIPVSFPDSFVQKVESAGAKAVKVSEPMEICKDVHLTGEMGINIKEHSLIFDTSEGLVVLTGCAHPGVADIVKKSGEILKKKVHFVFGGFHLMQKSEPEVMEIIKQFSKAGVVKCGATHCTGDEQIEIFEREYKKNYVPMGTGNVIKIKK
jgi:7,8-dihydropterin-6-yl-methyl-4-(beta-D-ribofuranosyl)aminobenzene 5'-phosphate synthase